MDAGDPDAGFVDAGQPNWIDPAWTRRKLITIDASQVSAPIAMAHGDFPVLISIIDADIQAAARADGLDIRFATDTAFLDHEVEAYDGSTGTLVAWVRISQLSALEDTSFFVYYGNPNAVDQSNPAAVWSSGFAGVWHLSEDTVSGGTSGVHVDSTANDHDGAQRGNSDVIGFIDRAQSFDGFNDYITVGNPPGLDITGNAITVEAWINADNWESQSFEGTIVDKHAWENGDNGYVLRTGNNGRAAFVVGNNGWREVVSAQLMNTDTWYYLAGVYDGSTVRIYIDAIERDSASASFSIGSNNYGVRFGRGTYGTSRRFDGFIDEVRVSDVARSPGWIQTTYNNQRNPGVGGFLSSIGPEELGP